MISVVRHRFSKNLSCLCVERSGVGECWEAIAKIQRRGKVREAKGMKLLFKKVGKLLAQGNVVLLSGSFKGLPEVHDAGFKVSPVSVIAFFSSHVQEKENWI